MIIDCAAHRAHSIVSIMRVRAVPLENYFKEYHEYLEPKGYYSNFRYNNKAHQNHIIVCESVSVYVCIYVGTNYMTGQVLWILLPCVRHVSDIASAFCYNRLLNLVQ